MSQKNASKTLPADSDIPFGHSWHNTKTPSVVRNGLSAVTMPLRSVAVPINPQWGRESYAVIQQPDIPTNRLVYPVPFNTIFPSGVP